jgi:hypothetical protein
MRFASISFDKGKLNQESDQEMPKLHTALTISVNYRWFPNLPHPESLLSGSYLAGIDE